MHKSAPTLITLSALILMSASASAASIRDDICAKGVFNAGVKYDSPPFGFVDENGDVTGFDVQSGQGDRQGPLGRVQEAH